MDVVTLVVVWAVIVMAGVSTVLTIADGMGFLPLSISRWLNSRRLDFSVELLKKMGVTFPASEDTNSGADYPSSLKTKLKEVTVKKTVDVGHVEKASFSEFIDVQGATTKSTNAQYFARELSSFLSREKILGGHSRKYQFDYVACSKDGSPILAYEFSKLVDKPLILLPTMDKFGSASSDPEKFADFAGKRLKKSARCLVVDDSTTGGRKVLNVVSKVRALGLRVEHCLVLFEPTGKAARDRLQKEKITLHSVVKGPKMVN